MILGKKKCDFVVSGRYFQFLGQNSYHNYGFKVKKLGSDRNLGFFKVEIGLIFAFSGRNFQF